MGGGREAPSLGRQKYKCDMRISSQLQTHGPLEGQWRRESSRSLCQSMVAARPSDQQGQPPVAQTWRADLLLENNSALTRCVSVCGSVSSSFCLYVSKTMQILHGSNNMCDSSPKHINLFLSFTYNNRTFFKLCGRTKTQGAHDPTSLSLKELTSPILSCCSHWS